VLRVYVIRTRAERVRVSASSHTDSQLKNFSLFINTYNEPICVKSIWRKYKNIYVHTDQRIGPYWLPHAAILTPTCSHTDSHMQPYWLPHAAILTRTCSHTDSHMQPYWLPHAAILTPTCSHTDSYMQPYWLVHIYKHLRIYARPPARPPARKFWPTKKKVLAYQKKSFGRPKTTFVLRHLYYDICMRVRVRLVHILSWPGNNFIKIYIYLLTFLVSVI